MTFHPCASGPFGRGFDRADLPAPLGLRRRAPWRWGRHCWRRAAAAMTPAAAVAVKRSSCSRPDNPVTLPTFDDIPTIADGLDPEAGPLKIYNYAEYIAPQTLRGFDSSTAWTSRSRPSPAWTRPSPACREARPEFDLFFATTDVIGKASTGRLLQPLNASYLGNSANIWDQLQDPFYDVGAAVQPPVHDVHDRHRVPDRPGRRRRPDELRQPVRHPLGPGVHGRPLPARRRPRGAGHGHAPRAVRPT